MYVVDNEKNSLTEYKYGPHSQSWWKEEMANLLQKPLQHK